MWAKWSVSQYFYIPLPICVPKNLSCHDRIYTDIAMAHNAGAVGCLVLSGETTIEVAQQAERQPDIIARDIEQLGDWLAESRE